MPVPKDHARAPSDLLGLISDCLGKVCFRSVSSDNGLCLGGPVRYLDIQLPLANNSPDRSLMGEARDKGYRKALLPGLFASREAAPC